MGSWGESVQTCLLLPPGSTAFLEQSSKLKTISCKNHCAIKKCFHLGPRILRLPLFVLLNISRQILHSVSILTSDLTLTTLSLRIKVVRIFVFNQRNSVPMGKRKRATKPPPKKKVAKLEKIFDCPFCGHEQTVDCVIERDINLGKVECRVCGVKYSSIIHRLEEEIDVYSKWIDACEAANRDPTAGSALPEVDEKEGEGEEGRKEAIESVADIVEEAGEDVEEEY